jgi:hypothetical protein
MGTETMQDEKQRVILVGLNNTGEKESVDIEASMEELETDRRHILRRIDDIQHELKEVRKNRRVQRGT